MVPLSVIKEQYQQMTDEALMAFAANEADKLTIESFHLLKEEFDKRNLDFNVLNEAEVDRSLAEMGKQNAAEKAAAEGYVESVWMFALDAKEAGKKDAEIYRGLLRRGLEAGSAGMLVEGLGARVRELKEEAKTHIIWGWVVALAGFIALSLGAMGEVEGRFALYGFVIACGGGYRLYRGYSGKDRFEKIEQQILKEREEEDRAPEDELAGSWEHGLADTDGKGALWGWSFLFQANGTGIYRFWSEARLQDETLFLWERIGENLIKAKYAEEEGWYVIRYSIAMAERPGGGNVWKLTNESYRAEKAGENGFWTDIEVLYKPV